MAAAPLPQHAAFAAQRYAVDYFRLDGDGRLVAGDPTGVRNHAAYGADLLAVAWQPPMIVPRAT